jgi:hypothetical protein
MGKQKRKLKVIKNDEQLNKMKSILIAALAIIIFYPPYLQGLFFEKHILPTGIFVFSVFIAFLVYKWLRKDFAFLKTPIEYIALAVFCKYFFPKVAKYFSIVLQQEFPQCCKPYFAKLLVHCRQ